MPNWYSTMFGVRVFAASAVLGLALNILVTLGCSRAGVVEDAINVEHFHDLGKLMFGFLVFWAYISFSEFFLIWYAAIPEETIYYHQRWDSPWWRDDQRLAGGLEVHHPVLSGHVAQREAQLRPARARRGLDLRDAPRRDVLLDHAALRARASTCRSRSSGLATDVGCVFACVGLYLAVVFRRMLNHP